MGNVEKAFLHQLINGVPELSAANPFTLRLRIGIDDFTIVFNDPVIRPFCPFHRLHLPFTEKIKINEHRPFIERPESRRAEKFFLEPYLFIHAEKQLQRNGREIYMARNCAVLVARLHSLIQASKSSLK